MAHFVKRSKHPKNCLSNHRLIGLLIRRGMGIPNDPLPEVEEQPNHVPVVMAEPEQLNPMPAVVIEPAVENPIPGPSHEPHPSAATTVKSPTVTASKSTQRRKLKTRSNSNTTQRGIDRVEPEATQNPPVAATECPDFADAQTLPDFDINNTNLSEPQIDLMEIRIPGFTLCKELQETILSIQAECKQIAPESSALLDDSVHHSSSDEVQIIQNPSIADFPPCLVVEECPPSPKSRKRKTPVFVSTLPRRRTRSARSTGASSWMEAYGTCNTHSSSIILRC
jgi:hypothetical protein